jgi:lysophospholipid hydrolase
MFILGHASFVTIRAKTDAQVGFLPKASLDRYMERYPNVLLTLAKRLITQLSPLVLHIDVALDWAHANAGQVLFRQGDPSDSIYMVLNGRLRSIVENVIGTSSDDFDLDQHSSMISPQTSFEIKGEFGPGESVGELEVLTDTKRPTTVHAIRDTEIAVMPKTLFNALAVRHPEITIQISRIIASRSRELARASLATISSPNYLVGSLGSANSGGADMGRNNVNLKTVAILPINQRVPIVDFSERLKSAFQQVGASIALLNTATVMNKLGRHAFSRIGKLKLVSWLGEQEENNRLVLYLADGGVSSPWTQRCVRQADCILLVGLGDEDPSIGEYERLIISMKTTARKELVLLHNERSCVPGSTAAWLKSRLWIHAHHHVQMASPRILRPSSRENTLNNLTMHFRKYYTKATGFSHGLDNPSPNIHTGIRSDFARLARRLLNKSIGLALGGGGARGISQIGIIRAFEEAGIPIDMIGGTSIGSFVGGLFARENDHVSVWGRAKSFSAKMVSKWRQIMDITYPTTSLFTGTSFFKSPAFF